MDRITREEYYLQILEAVRLRSTCERGRSGAVLVKDGRLISTGYVGAPAGVPHCDDVGHMLQERRLFQKVDENGLRDYKYSSHCIRTVHAELNAILYAARYGIGVAGATMYCTMTPCYDCAKAIVNAGIEEVISVYSYQAEQDSIILFKRAGVKLKILRPQETLGYERKKKK